MVRGIYGLGLGGRVGHTSKHSDLIKLHVPIPPPPDDASPPRKALHYALHYVRRLCYKPLYLGYSPPSLSALLVGGRDAAEQAGNEWSNSNTSNGL